MAPTAAFEEALMGACEGAALAQDLAQDLFIVAGGEEENPPSGGEEEGDVAAAPRMAEADPLITAWVEEAATAAATAEVTGATAEVTGVMVAMEGVMAAAMVEAMELGVTAAAMEEITAEVTQGIMAGATEEAMEEVNVGGLACPLGRAVGRGSGMALPLCGRGLWAPLPLPHLCLAGGEGTGLWERPSMQCTQLTLQARHHGHEALSGGDPPWACERQAQC